MKKHSRLVWGVGGVATVSFLPGVLLAQATGSIGFGTLTDIINYALSITSLILPILFALAFIIFFWGLSKFILNSSGAPAEIAKGKSYMMWGILALFILVSARTLISMAANDLDVPGGAKIIPSLPGGKSN